MPQQLRTRIVSGLIFGAIVLGLIFIHQYTRYLFLILVGALCLWEYHKITLKQTKTTAFWTIIGIILLFSSLVIEVDVNIYRILLFLSALWALLCVLNLFVPKLPLHSSLSVGTAFMYIVLPLFLFITYGKDQDLMVALLVMIGLIWISDSAAYFVGSAIGKRKLFERLSPKKTKEGFYGAGMTTVICAFVLYSFVQTHILQYWIALGLSIWLFGTLGDLFESQLKRQFGLKDSGNVMPGHGGFLDRFDSFIFSIPFVLLISLIFS